MSLGRIVRLVAAVAIAASFPIFVWVATASAQVSTGCLATIAGKNASAASTPGSAIGVDHDSVVTVTGNAPARVVAHHIQLEFAGFKWTASSGVDNGKSWSGTVNVKKYAKYGVGLYKVVGVTVGPGACAGSAFVKVTGRNPLTTVAGAAAAATTAVGVVGLAYSAARSGYGTSVMDTAMNAYDQAVAPTTPAEPETPSQWGTSDQEMRDLDKQVKAQTGGYVALCLLALPKALLSTMALMVAGAGAPGAPGMRPVPRVRWHPRISILGLVAGLLGALGALVLLQQYAIVYPTRTVSIVSLAAGFLVGLVLPSVRRIFATRKLNRALAARAR